VRDERDGEARVVERGDRERDAVDRDRAFFDAVPQDVGRRVDPDRLPDVPHMPDRVDVPLDDVAAERLAGT